MKVVLLVLACLGACALLSTGVTATEGSFCETNVPNSEENVERVSVDRTMPPDCLCKDGYAGLGGAPNAIEGHCIKLQKGTCVPKSLRIAFHYNGFFSGNYVSNYSDIQGALAVGGDCSVFGYEINGQGKPTGQRENFPLDYAPCEVGGKFVSGQGVSLRGGNLVYGPGTAVEHVARDLAVSYDDGFGPLDRSLDTVPDLDFAGIANSFKKWSAQLAALPATGTLTVETFGDWRKVDLEGDNKHGFNVFNLSCDLLTLADRHLSKVPEGSKVLFNIHCGANKAAQWKFVQDTLPTGKHSIIWNFVDATSLYLEGINIKGILLAPHADILTGPSGGLIEGKVFAKSFGPYGGIQTGGTVQINLLPYDDGFVPDCPNDEDFEPSECQPCRPGQYCDKSNPNAPTCLDCPCRISDNVCDGPPKCKQVPDAPFYDCDYDDLPQGTPCVEDGQNPPTCEAVTIPKDAVSVKYNKKYITGSPSTHAFYLPNIFPKGECGSGNSNDLAGTRIWKWVTNDVTCPPRIVVDEFAKTLKLTGCIYLGHQEAFKNHQFRVDVLFSGKVAAVPSGSPKKELIAACYVPNAGCGDPIFQVNPATWDYYTSVNGTLTTRPLPNGFLEPSAELLIKRMGPAAQVGNGANGKTLKYGLSTWFTMTWKNGQIPSSQYYTPKKCKCNPTPTNHGDINIDIDPPACPPTEVGLCLDNDCTLTTCPNFGVDAVGTFKLRNGGRVCEGQAYGLRLDSLYDYLPTDDTRRKTVWSFDHASTDCTADVRLSVTGANQNGDKIVRISGTVCGGPIKDGKFQGPDGKDGTIRKAVLDLTIEGARKFTTNGGGCRADKGHTSYGFLNDTLENRVIELRTASAFEVKRSIYVFEGLVDQLTYNCRSDVIKTSELHFLVDECKSPLTQLRPQSTNCQEVPVRSTLQVSAGPWDSVTSTVRLNTLFSTLAVSNQMSESAFASRFITDLVFTQSRLEGDPSRISILSVNEEAGRTLVTFRIIKSRNSTREIAYRNSAFNATEAIATQIKDSKSLLRRGVVTMHLDGAAGIVSPTVTAGAPNPGSGDEPTPSSSQFSTTEIGAIAGAGGVALLALMVVIGMKLRRRSQSKQAEVEMDRVNSQSSMSTLAIIPEENAASAAPVRQSPFKFPEGV